METTFSKIKVDSISDSAKLGKDGKPLRQAQLRQTVTRSLPSTRVTNSLKGNIYDNAALGITSNDYEEVRVAWMEVPKTATVESVQADLDKFTQAKLYRILSSQIILSDDQINVYKIGLSGAALESFNEKYGIKTGTAWSEEHVKFFLNNIANRQVVRYGEGNPEGKPADEIVSFNGKQQFRRVELAEFGAEDIDMRATVEVKSIEDIELAPANTSKVAEAAKEEAKAA